jgi:hypothetical protein
MMNRHDHLQRVTQNKFPKDKPKGLPIPDGVPTQKNLTLCEKLLDALLQSQKEVKEGLKQFLTDIKNDPCLKKDMDDIHDRKKFITFLKDTLKQQLNRQKKYQLLTGQDIEEAAKLIPSEEEKSKPENPAKVPKIVGRIWC